MWHDVFADANTNFMLLLLFLLPAVQWVTGILRAIAATPSTFSLEYVDTFIRTDVAGRILPITILILLGRVLTVAAPGDFHVPGLDLGVLTGAGLGMAVVYLVVVVKRILDNVNPSTPDAPPTE